MVTRSRRTSDVLYSDVAGSSEFSQGEVRSLFREFRGIASAGQLNRQQFREAIGILGTFRDSVIPDRLFDAFDLDRDGLIDAREYVAGMSVMTRGTAEEKLELSFRMADLDNSGTVTVDEVHIIFESYYRILSSMGLRSGVGSRIWRSDVQALFNDLPNGDEITLEQYSAAMKGLDIVEWLKENERADAESAEMAARITSRDRRLTYVLQRTGEVTQEELDSMSVKQLKEMMMRRKVSLTGCVEKADMKAKAKEAGLVIPQEMEGLVDEDEGDDDGNDGDAADPDTAETAGDAEDLSALSLPEALQRIEQEVLACLEKTDMLTAHLKGEESAGAAGISGSDVAVDDARGAVAEIQQKLSGILDLAGRADAASQSIQLAGASAAAAAAAAAGAGVGADAGVGGGSGGGSAPPAPPALTVKTAGDGTRSDGSLDLTLPRSQARRPSRAPTRNKHIGDPVGFVHRSWDLVMNVMLGVRLAVGRVAKEAGREITPTDFKQHDRYTLSASPGAQSDAVQAMASTSRGKTKDLPPYVFIDHCPQVFHQLRLMLGIDTDDYMKSVGPESLLSNLFMGNLSSLSELVSEGKSGSFFYFTHDGRYMIKTLRESEKHCLSEILPDYFYHIQRNPDSMMTRFLGMHELHKRDMQKPKDAPQKYYFVVMQSVFLTRREIHEQFDLKGSWIKRLTDPTKRLGQTLKDLDWCKVDIDESWNGRFGVPFSKTAEAVRLIEHPQRKMQLGPERKEQFMSTVRKDIAFLERHHIIDYSLLLGIHKPHGNSMAGTQNPLRAARRESADNVRPGPSTGTETARPVPFFQRDSGGMRAQDSEDLYFVGVIDILIQFGAKKRMEHKWKSVRTPSKNTRGEHGISVVPPEEYARRFVNFMDAITQ